MRGEGEVDAAPAWHEAVNTPTVEEAGGSDCPTSAGDASATWCWQLSPWAGTAPAAAE